MSEVWYIILLHNFGIRLKLERQTVTLDSSCVELGVQKHDGTTTPSQGNTQRFKLEVWLTF